MFKYTTKFEVNFLDQRTIAADIQQLPNIVIKGKVPAIVVAQEFLDAILMERMRFNSKFKIIACVDFANGKTYALDKLKYINQATFKCDGIEVMLTANKSDKESSNEMKAITEFVKRINPMMEIRWVFGLRTKPVESYSNFFPYLKVWPANFVRTDNNLESPLANLDTHIYEVDLLRNWCATPIKVSGNIDLVTMMSIPKAARFDVTISQARKIMNEINEPAVFNKIEESVIQHNPSIEEIQEVHSDLEEIENIEMRP